MRLVIDIPEEIYMDIKEEVRTKVNTFEHIPFLHEVISVGTLLPKGHGELIYAEDAIETLQIMFAGNEDIQNACEQCILDCPTIIEADAESEVPNADSD